MFLIVDKIECHKMRKSMIFIIYTIYKICNIIHVYEKID